MKVVRFAPNATVPVSSLRDVSTPAQLAEHLVVSVATVYRWTTKGGGPAFIKLASGDRGRFGPCGSVRFRREDVEAWLEGLRVDQRPRPKRRRRSGIRTHHQAAAAEGIAS